MKVYRVHFYSGGKKREKPRFIFTDGGVIRVKEIIEQKYEEDYESKERKRVFLFRSREGGTYRLEVNGENFGIEEIEI